MEENKMNEKQSKDFKSLEEVEEFLKKFPEMQTGFIHVDFEKKETSGDKATDAMQSEIEQIYHELDAIKDRHPNLKTFHVDFEFGKNQHEEPEPVEAKPKFDYDKCLAGVLDKSYNYDEFKKNFRKEMHAQGGMPNVIKTIEYLATEAAEAEVWNFKRDLAALLYKVVYGLKNNEK